VHTTHAQKKTFTQGSEITTFAYLRVNHKGRRLDITDTLKWHQEEHQWLVSEFAKAKENEKVLALTHHCPVLFW
jgi:hypothetical protein